MRILAILYLQPDIKNDAKQMLKFSGNHATYNIVSQDDEQKIRDKIDQYEKLNDISTDDVEQKEEEVKVEESSETDPDTVTETEEIQTTTLSTLEPTTKSTKETTSQGRDKF